MSLSDGCVALEPQTRSLERSVEYAAYRSNSMYSTSFCIYRD